jgi:hypothetical protein
MNATQSSPTAGLVRRSARLAAKQPISFISEDDIIFDAIQKYCDEKGYDANLDLLDDFKLDCSTKKSVFQAIYSSPLYDRGRFWAMQYSKNIQQQCLNRKLVKALYAYCQRNGLVYTNSMAKHFLQWYSDPANNHIITANIPGVYPHPQPPAYCIKKWLSARN